MSCLYQQTTLWKSCGERLASAVNNMTLTVVG